MNAGSRNERLHALASAATLLFAIAVVYSPILTFNFLNWDDQDTLAENPLMNPPTLGTLRHFWTAPHMSLYVPVTYTVWAAVGRLFSDNGALRAVGFRVLSLALHATAALLVLHIVRRTLRVGYIVALLAALLFALHPVQVEAVCWISGAKDLLAADFSLTCVLAAIIGCGRRRPAGWFLAASVLALLAMLSKPTTATLPALTLAICLALRPARVGRPLLVAAIIGVIALPIVFVAKTVQPGDMVPPTAIWQRPLVAGFSLAFYELKLLLPAHLAVSYGWDLPATLSSEWFKVAWLLPLATAGAIFLSLRWTRWLAAAAVVFVVAVLPVLGLIPFEFQAQSTVADHYLYIAILGPRSPWLG